MSRIFVSMLIFIKYFFLCPCSKSDIQWSFLIFEFSKFEYRVCFFVLGEPSDSIYRFGLQGRFRNEEFQAQSASRSESNCGGLTDYLNRVEAAAQKEQDYTHFLDGSPMNADLYWAKMD